MTRFSTSNTTRAMTLLEVLVVLLVLTILAAMIVPMTNHPDRSPLFQCLSNAKQIDLGFLLYAEDNGGNFPMQTSLTNGGTMEFAQRNQTYPHYQKLSDYVRYLGVFVCPLDKTRQMAADYPSLTDTNLSYFLNLDVSTNNAAKTIMVGDRNLEANNKPVPRGTFILTTNMNVAWTRELHRDVDVLGFADGHAELCLRTNLNRIVRQQNLAAIRLSVP